MSSAARGNQFRKWRPDFGRTRRALGEPASSAQLAEMARNGAEHITFGDPDFFNGVGHGIRLVEELHGQFPDQRFDRQIETAHLGSHFR